MTLDQLLAGVPEVACPPLSQTRLQESTVPGTVVAASAAKQAGSGKKVSDGMLINPPNWKPYSPFAPLPGYGSGSGSFGITPGPTPPSPPTPGQGIGPLYNSTPLRIPIPDGPPVDVAFLKIGSNGTTPALAVLTKHMIHIFPIPDTLSWNIPQGGIISWSGTLNIPVPSQVTTWAPEPADRYTVDGAHAVRLRVADLNNDGRDDLTVVTNWDDPAWPSGVNQFGYTGTWVYYQDPAATFESPFSPGGASREYDISASNAVDNVIPAPHSVLPGLEGVQNPHVSFPGHSPYYQLFADEFYDHRTFKDAGPAAPPQPQGFLFGQQTFGLGQDEYRYSSVEKTDLDGDPIGDLVTPLSIRFGDTGTVSSLFLLWWGYPWQSGFQVWAGYPTADAAFRARPGKFEPNESVIDYALTFPVSGSLQIAHPSEMAPPPDGLGYNGQHLEFYSPRVLRLDTGSTALIGHPREVQVADLTGDALSDVVVLNDDHLFVLRNLGNRTFLITDEFPVQDEPQRAAISSVLRGNARPLAAIDTIASSVVIYIPVTTK